MYPIAVVTLFAICVFIERMFWWLRFTAKRSPKQVDAVYEALEAGSLSKAIEQSSKSGDPVVRMIHHGLNHRHTSMQGALEVAAGQELRDAGRFLSAMDTIVTLAPLLGLLGTIFGLITAFSSISQASAAERQAVLADGISQAMYTTAFGIVAAVPLLFFHYLLTARQESMLNEMEAAATSVMVGLTGAAHESKDEG